jgi:uncharacterized membrane protein
VSIQDWLNLGLRWLHLVVGISWIGNSLYFMWLDASLEKPAPPREGVEGEVWLLHSGGFYQVAKRTLGPGLVPTTLHWFKWEAALTWLSGFGLLTVVYYLSGGVYLIDPAVATPIISPLVSPRGAAQLALPLSPGQATALSLGVLVVSWLVYDGLWATLGRRRPGAATVISFALLGGAVYGLCHVLSGRGAYIHVGALLGTIMVANVWMRIVPAQRDMLAATEAGRPPDPTLSREAKRRSTHNSYVTFPVLFTMFSNHFPGTYGHPLNWLILSLLIVVGVGVRALMIASERRRPAAWVWAPVAAALLGFLYLTSPASLAASAPKARPAGGRPVAFAVVRGIIALRCLSCHSTTPSDDVFRAAPNGVTFDTPESLRARAELIKQRTVLVKNMPLANKTGMTEEERILIGRWIDQGAVTGR